MSVSARTLPWDFQWDTVLLDGLLGPPRLLQRDNCNACTDLRRSQPAWLTTAAHSTWWGSFSQTRLWGRHTPFPVQLCCYEHIHPLFLEVQTLFKLRESGLRFVKAHTLLLILSSDPQLANDKPYIFGRTFGQNNGCYFTCPLSLILQIF